MGNKNSTSGAVNEENRIQRSNSEIHSRASETSSRRTRTRNSSTRDESLESSFSNVLNFFTGENNVRFRSESNLPNNVLSSPRQQQQPQIIERNGALFAIIGNRVIPIQKPQKCEFCDKI